MSSGRRVVVVGWSRGFRKVSFNDLLRKKAGMGLTEAKTTVDRILDGERVDVHLPDEAGARAFIARAVELGAIVADSEPEE